MKQDVRLPDCEVVVTVYGSEAYSFAAWLDPDIHQGLHIVAAIDDPTSTQAVVAFLQAAITQAQRAVWRSVDELAAAAGEAGGEPPF